MKYFLPTAEKFIEIDVRQENGQLIVTRENQSFRVEVLPLGNQYFSLLVDHRSFLVKANPGKKDIHLEINHRETVVRILDTRQKIESEIFGAEEAAAGSGEVKAPMPGMVLKLEVQPGDAVVAGQPLVVMEAMKMENEIRATEAGTVAEILVKPQQAVEKDDVLIRLTR